MKKILIKSLFILLIVALSGCSLKSNDELFELKPKLNTLTKRANTAIERRGIKIDKIKIFLDEKYPIMMEDFKDFDIKIKYENEITIVLICQDNKAIFEDLSCDLKIDKDYIKEDKECSFYITNPLCEE